MSTLNRILQKRHFHFCPGTKHSSQLPVVDSTDHAGDVYVINNSKSDNKVVHYTRSSDGSLVKEASYSNADDRNILAFSIDSTPGALTMIGDYCELIHNAAGLACK